ncbi:S-adenosyl-L-methionine-dependent methyltransferase [Microlunatus endophyticus]|uniref:S-adenosyl-L-methionine-dependent methyltransferase n=1 Tax=Microlunatus endophyticus TaxID=1716077 RepID=A0A917SFS8_9ACTN|nr:SAM-dependent methyltransferase [Microlunatus endophyticus]GGL77607.1 S-adenosyl-L-methionine-dependent methyltransferase [Microlunatus endophyticus]
MRAGEPSRTAYGAAMHRAMHQQLEGGRVFRDPLAWRILGTDYDEVVASGRYVDRKPLRIMIAVRHRFGEDRLAGAIERGTRQVVILGAGLDTFAYRNPFPDVACYEVDFPATGAWKQQQLAAAGIVEPSTLHRVGVDFEADDDLLARLVESGFDTGRPAFFLWLGVVPYLTPEAVRQTLRTIADISGSEVVFDYTNPADQLSEGGRLARERFSARVGRAGEPMVATFDTAELHDLLGRLGFNQIVDLDRDVIRTRFLGLPSDGESGGAHVLSAVVR